MTVDGGDAPARPEARLRARFIRTGESRDLIEVDLPDGSASTWNPRSMGSRPPHDLILLIAEAALGLTEGFWGLMLQGVDLLSVRAPQRGQVWPNLDRDTIDRLTQSEAVLSSVTEPAPPGATVDAGLLARTIAGACARMGVPAPEALDEARCELLAAQVAAAHRRWNALAAGSGLSFGFP